MHYFRFEMGICHCHIQRWYTIHSTMNVSFQGEPLHWRHNYHDGVSNHQPHGCLLNRLFRRRSKKTSKLRITGLWVGNSPGPVNSPHKGPVTRKMFPFDDVIMFLHDSDRKRNEHVSRPTGWDVHVHVWTAMAQLFTQNSRALFQYKDRLSKVWGFPC